MLSRPVPWEGARTCWHDAWIYPFPLLVAVVLPLVAWTVIALTFREPVIREVPLVVVDHSRTPLSRALIRSLDATQVLRVSEVLSQDSEATALIQRGEATLGVFIPREFHREVAGGGSTEVAILANGAQLLYSKVAYRSAASAVSALSAGIQIRRLMAGGMGEDEATVRAAPVRTNIQAPGNPWYDYAIYLIPGTALAILQMSASFSALWIFREHGDRSSGLLLPPPGRRLAFILTRAGLLLLANLVSVVLLFLVLLPFAGVPPVPAFLPLMVRSTLFVLVCLGMGAFISLVSRDLVFATQAALVINAPALVFSGFTFPRWAMPEAVQAIASLIPLSHMLDGLVPVLTFGVEVGTGIPELLLFLLIFWGSVFLLSGSPGDRIREWQAGLALRMSAATTGAGGARPRGGSGPGAERRYGRGSGSGSGAGRESQDGGEGSRP